MELLIVSALVGILSLLLGGLIRSLVTAFSQNDTQTRAQDNLQVALSVFSRDILDANQFVDATATKMQFYMDSSHLPGYYLTDLTNAGLPRFEDPDDDADLYVIRTNKPWATGVDLDDDDDDGDDRRDVECRYSIDSGRLTVSYRYNEAPWSPDRVLLTHVASSSFTYEGSFRETGSLALDTNGDRSISEDEIAASDPGSVSTLFIDSFKELSLIRGVGVQWQVDLNGDGRNDGHTSGIFHTPFVGIKEKYP